MPEESTTKLERAQWDYDRAVLARDQADVHLDGDIVKVRRNRAVGHFPPELIVLVAVPPGFSPDDAMADLVGEPRPLMKQVGRRAVTYILCQEDSPKVYSCRERDLLPSSKEPVEIGTVSRAP